MYTPAASAAELAMWGLLPSDIEPVEVFADNREAFDLFCYMSTQWMVGMCGATGLKYEVAHQRLDRMGLSLGEYDSRMADLRIMEQAALRAMHEQLKGK